MASRLMVRARRNAINIRVRMVKVYVVIDRFGDEISYGTQTLLPDDRFAVVGDCNEVRDLVASGDLVLLGEIDD